MNCNFYSDYESGQYDFGVCHYEEAEGGFPMVCTHKDNEENCTCFELIKEEKRNTSTSNIEFGMGLDVVRYSDGLAVYLNDEQVAG